MFYPQNVSPYINAVINFAHAYLNQMQNCGNISQQEAIVVRNSLSSADAAPWINNKILTTYGNVTLGNDILQRLAIDMVNGLIISGRRVANGAASQPLQQNIIPNNYTPQPFGYGNKQTISDLMDIQRTTTPDANSQKKMDMSAEIESLRAQIAELKEEKKKATYSLMNEMSVAASRKKVEEDMRREPYQKTAIQISEDDALEAISRCNLLRIEEYQKKDTHITYQEVKIDSDATFASEREGINFITNNIAPKIRDDSATLVNMDILSIAKAGFDECMAIYESRIGAYRNSSLNTIDEFFTFIQGIKQTGIMFENVIGKMIFQIFNELCSVSMRKRNPATGGLMGEDPVTGLTDVMNRMRTFMEWAASTNSRPDTLISCLEQSLGATVRREGKMMNLNDDSHLIDFILRSHTGITYSDADYVMSISEDELKTLRNQAKEFFPLFIRRKFLIFNIPDLIPDIDDGRTHTLRTPIEDIIDDILMNVGGVSYAIDISKCGTSYEEIPVLVVGKTFNNELAVRRMNR